MPPKMVAIFRERIVLRTVYVEMPKRRRFSSNNNHRPLHYRASNGPNRRADLLDYSRRVQVSSRSGLSNPLILHPKPKSSLSNNQHPLKQLKTEVPSFLRSVVSKCKQGLKATKKKRASEPIAAQMKIVMQRFQKQKKPGFFSKLFAGMRKLK